MSEPIPGTRCIVATCALDQWALDFDGNQDRIAESIRRAKAAGATYRLGMRIQDVSRYITSYALIDLHLRRTGA